MLVTGKPGCEEVRVDLKGIVYRGSIVPLAGTCCVINIGPHEAKVEALVNDLVRLTEESNFYQSETLVEGTLGDLLGSDDEHYVPAGNAACRLSFYLRSHITN